MSPHEIMILNACYKCSSPSVNVLPHIWNSSAAIDTRRRFVELGLIDPETHKATAKGEQHIESLCAVGLADKTPALPEPLASIIAGIKGVTPGPWWADSERSEGGDGTFDAFAVYGPERRHDQPSSICDTHNSGEIRIQHEHDTTPWDEQGRVNMDHIARCDPDTMRTIATQLQEALDRATTAEDALATAEAERDAAHNEALERAAEICDREQARQSKSGLGTFEAIIARNLANAIRRIKKGTPNADR